MKRTIDELGRFVIPILIRKELNINTGDTLNIEKKQDKIILSKQNTYEELVKQRKSIEKAIQKLEEEGQNGR